MLDLYNLYNELINNYINKMNTGTNFQERIQIETFKIEDKNGRIKKLTSSHSKVYFYKTYQKV